MSEMNCFLTESIWFEEMASSFLRENRPGKGRWLAVLLLKQVSSLQNLICKTNKALHFEHKLWVTGVKADAEEWVDGRLAQILFERLGVDR